MRHLTFMMLIVCLYGAVAAIPWPHKIELNDCTCESVGGGQDEMTSFFLREGRGWATMTKDDVKGVEKLTIFRRHDL